MIEILRLKNGEDIIGEVYDNTVNMILDIHEPMSVQVVDGGHKQGLVMSHWLPIQLIQRNEVKINSCDVLTRFSPNDEFREYYENTVSKMKTLLEAKRYTDSLTDEEIEDVMDALEESQGHSLH